jgi:hypothetical protein
MLLNQSKNNPILNRRDRDIFCRTILLNGGVFLKKLVLIVMFSFPLLLVLNGCQKESSNEKEQHQVMGVKNNEKQSLDVRVRFGIN